VRHALTQAFGYAFNVYVNWDGHTLWYQACATANKVASSFDMFESGRLEAYTLWTEDGFYDDAAQQ
jgi:hypothetical protein